jgi:hypothetical protein
VVVAVVDAVAAEATTAVAADAAIAGRFGLRAFFDAVKLETRRRGEEFLSASPRLAVSASRYSIFPSKFARLTTISSIAAVR